MGAEDAGLIPGSFLPACEAASRGGAGWGWSLSDSGKSQLWISK